MISVKYESLFSDAGPKDTNGDPFAIDVPDNLRWIAMMDRLSGGDLTKHEAIYEKNYIECLNLLSYWYFRDKIEDQMRRQQELRNKMR
jgi:hypothetical protein